MIKTVALARPQIPSPNLSPAATSGKLLVPESKRLNGPYTLAIPPYYFSLIDVDDPNDPIRMQSCPSTAEMTSETGLELEDPLEEDKDSPVPGLTHRNPDRVLTVTTHVGSMYCWFCTRRQVTMDRDG